MEDKHIRDTRERVDWYGKGQINTAGGHRVELRHSRHTGDTVVTIG